MRALRIEIALLRMRFETRMSLKACAQKRRCAKMFALRNEGVRLNACAQKRGYAKTRALGQEMIGE